MALSIHVSRCNLKQYFKRAWSDQNYFCRKSYCIPLPYRISLCLCSPFWYPRISLGDSVQPVLQCLTSPVACKKIYPFQISDPAVFYPSFFHNAMQYSSIFPAESCTISDFSRQPAFFKHMPWYSLSDFCFSFDNLPESRLIIFSSCDMIESIRFCPYRTDRSEFYAN